MYICINGSFSILMQFSFANISQSISSNQLKQFNMLFYAFRTNSSNLETRIGEDRTNQNRRFDSDLRNLDFNTGFPPSQPLFKYNDNHISVGYTRSFLVWVYVYPIPLHFQNFLGTHEP